jgi:hypothetical protein
LAVLCRQLLRGSKFAAALLLLHPSNLSPRRVFWQDSISSSYFGGGSFFRRRRFGHFFGGGACGSGGGMGGNIDDVGCGRGFSGFGMPSSGRREQRAREASGLTGSMRLKQKRGAATTDLDVPE